MIGGANLDGATPLLSTAWPPVVSALAIAEDLLICSYGLPPNAPLGAQDIAAVAQHAVCSDADDWFSKKGVRLDVEISARS